VRKALLLLIIASSPRATTFVVGTDRDLVRSSTAIVVATAGESFGIRSARGLVQTITSMHVVVGNA